MPRRSIFVYDDALSEHVLSAEHPMKPVRLKYTKDLLQAYKAFDPANVELATPRQATEDELLTFHTADYIEAVRALGRNDPNVDASRFNFGAGDNPAYEGIYETSSWSTGASMRAVEALLSGEFETAFSVSGGLHHAMPSYAYGFCVFNDPVIAIKRLLAEGLKVAYVDIDCHHGDGVQHAFYDTDRVLTISFHESGAFLFPGTGFPQEVGAGRGRGYSVNVPLYPYTSDDVYLWAFNEIVPPLLRAFKPDVLVTQLGIDSHYADPITHLALTVQGHARVVGELSKLAPSMWLALGGGGYDLHAVARAWTLDFGVMSEQEFDLEIPNSYRTQHQVESLTDPDELPIQDSVVKDTRAFAEKSVKSVQGLVFSSHGIITA